VANKTKQQERDRRAKVEAMRKAQQARERRKSMIFVVIAVVLGLGLVAAAAVPAYLQSRNDPANKALAEFGVPAAKADCGEVISEPAEGNNVHEPDGTVVDYESVPPSSGPHWGAPAFPARAFYTARDRPEMEQLVHNLEHGYTILWYDETIKGSRLDLLRDLADSARAKDPVGPGEKFIVSAWDDAYGDFPKGKHIALSHWGAEQGHRQLCGDISGAVVADFIESYPFSDAPEPNAA
jgi:hypothetical protein